MWVVQEMNVGQYFGAEMVGTEGGEQQNQRATLSENKAGTEEHWKAAVPHANPRLKVA